MAFDELKAPADATHAMEALQTLERYIGWPALQQGLVAYREKFPAGGGTPDFVAWLAADRAQGANARTPAGSCA